MDNYNLTFGLQPPSYESIDSNPVLVVSDCEIFRCGENYISQLEGRKKQTVVVTIDLYCCCIGISRRVDLKLFILL